ncbi:hypothetical protein BH10PSE14_BH10PSE14_06730 [soil metagenome]
MDSVRIDVAGDRQVGLRFEQFPDVLYDELRDEIDSLAHELFARVQAATPIALGELRSQERLRIFTDKNRITGYIDIAGENRQDFIKAGALEYGAHGKANVSAHTRKLDHLWSQKLDAPITVMVDAYSRTANIAERRFERGSLESMRPEVIARLNAVVAKAVEKANA